MADKNIHSGHRQRMREQALKNGIEGMHEHQVLEYLLSFVIPQKDTNKLAHTLINKFGSLAGVFEADINELRKVNGIGNVASQFLFTFREFYYYYQRNKASHKSKIVNTGAAKEYFKPILVGKVVEELHIACIDTQNNVVHTEKLAQGSSTEVEVGIRKITELLIKNNCNSFVIAHNHPNGKCTPSEEDKKFTKALVLSSLLNKMKMLDHIIIGDDDIYSFYQNNQIEAFEMEYAKNLNEIDMLLKRMKVSQEYAHYEV